MNRLGSLAFTAACTSAGFAIGRRRLRGVHILRLVLSSVFSSPILREKCCQTKALKIPDKFRALFKVIDQKKTMTNRVIILSRPKTI